MPRSFTRSDLWVALLFLATVGFGLVTGVQVKLIAIAHAPVLPDAQGLPEVLMCKMITPVAILVILTYVFRKWQLSGLPVLATYTATAALPSAITMAHYAAIVFFAGMPDEIKTFFLQHLT